MKQGFKIIDSDMHIMEPPDLWENYVEAPLQTACAESRQCSEPRRF